MLMMDDIMYEDVAAARQEAERREE